MTRVNRGRSWSIVIAFCVVIAGAATVGVAVVRGDGDDVRTDHARTRTVGARSPGTAGSRPGPSPVDRTDERSSAGVRHLPAPKVFSAVTTPADAGAALVRSLRISEPPDLPEGVMGFEEFLATDEDTLDALQAVFGPRAPVTREADACLRAWVERGGDLRANYEWNFRVHLVSDGDQAHIEDLHSDDWPEAFDRELRRCYLRAYGSVSFETDRPFDYWVNYPLCLKGGVL